MDKVAEFALGTQALQDAIKFAIQKEKETRYFFTGKTPSQPNPIVLGSKLWAYKCELKNKTYVITVFNVDSHPANPNITVVPTFDRHYEEAIAQFESHLLSDLEGLKPSMDLDAASNANYRIFTCSNGEKIEINDRQDKAKISITFNIPETLVPDDLRKKHLRKKNAGGITLIQCD